jgi:hypothetical protein
MCWKSTNYEDPWYAIWTEVFICSSSLTGITALQSIDLWRWYINILVTIAILNIIHRPVLYLKLSSTLYVCPYLTRNTLRLRYESNRLMLSVGLWRWYINIMITILDVIHCPAFYLKRDISENKDRIQSPKRRVLNKRHNVGECPELW